MKTSELASQRIAFEEEKLAQQTAQVSVRDSEAELLRHKLKEQVQKNLFVYLLHGMKELPASDNLLPNVKYLLIFGCIYRY